jgi:hypothetical protein
MSVDNPVTPSRGNAEATPGNSQANDGQQPSADSEKGKSEGSVTISNEEYAQLQRNTARLKGYQKRQMPVKATRRPAGTKQSDSEYEDEPNEEYQQAIARNQELERQLFERDVREKTRELLSQDEFKSLPESTRKLILRNPASLSESVSIEEMMMDIEDFVREETAALIKPEKPVSDSPTGHETPQAVNAGNPAISEAEQLEDVSGLTGTSRSKAVFRNILKKSRGVKS